MDLNKLVGLIILVIVFFLVRDVFRTKCKGRPDKMIESIRTLGAATLFFIMAIGFFTTDKPFCYYFPFFCK